MTLSPTGKPRFAITTPLYYVNGLPHIGSAYTTIAADVVARFYRLQDYSVLMITGTDEHGQKIQRTAEERGVSPQQHCDEFAAGFVRLWDLLNIRCDRFIRTTAPRHNAIVNEFFQRMWDQGDIYKGQQQGWYCVSCEEFKEERDLLANKHCPIHTNKPVEWRDESNYFFKLSKYQQPLEQFYADYPSFIQPEARRNEVLSFVKRGLQDFSISRINLDWGFPVPTDPEHTLYVWFDALLGYLTALQDPSEPPSLDRATAHWWPVDVHLTGKDILRFHAISWPAMLMSAGLPLPGRVFSHGFLTKDGQKMGKSQGNTLDPVELVEKYGPDAVRYYFLREIEFGKDGDFSETRFINVLNADLANDLGNLLNRTLKMAARYCEGRVPGVDPQTIGADHALRAIGAGLTASTGEALSQLAFSHACTATLALVQASNKFLDDQAPWSLYKQGKQAETEVVLYAVLESVRQAAYLLSPIIPGISNQIYQQLGFAADFNDPAIGALLPYADHAAWGYLPPGQVLGEAAPVFQRLELPEPVASA